MILLPDDILIGNHGKPVADVVGLEGLVHEVAVVDDDDAAAEDFEPDDLAVPLAPFVDELVLLQLGEDDAEQVADDGETRRTRGVNLLGVTPLRDPVENHQRHG